MLTAARRRPALAAALLAAGFAAALAGLAGGPAGPEPAAAQGTAPAGHYWDAGTVTSTWEFLHVNLWNQPCADPCPPGLSGVLTKTTYCEIRATAAREIPEEGCSHSDPDWTWYDHGCLPSPFNPARLAGLCSDHRFNDTAVHACAGGLSSTVGDPAHCGRWAACGPGTQPNAGATACVRCPTGSHSHGGGVGITTVGFHANRGCQANHAAPSCLPGVTRDITRVWYPHDPAPGHAPLDKQGCGTPPTTTEADDCEPDADGNRQHRHAPGGDCEYHRPPPNPLCPDPVTESELKEWTVHADDGSNEGRSHRCDPPPPTTTEEEEDDDEGEGVDDPQTVTVYAPQAPDCPAGQAALQRYGRWGCFKQCPGAGWQPAASSCRPAAPARSEHPCWGLTPSGVAALLDYDTADNPYTYRGGPAKPDTHKWRFYAPVSLVRDGGDPPRRFGHLAWEQKFVKDLYWDAALPASSWQAGDGAAANDGWPVWEYAASYDFARPPTAGDMAAPSAGWAAAAAGAESDPGYRSGRAQRCGVVESRPVTVTLSAHAATFGCKHIAAVYGDVVLADGRTARGLVGGAPTSTTDTGLSSMVCYRRGGAGALGAPCAQPEAAQVAVPAAGRSGYFSITSTVVWQVRVLMDRSTGWTAPAGRAADGPCGSDARCGLLATVTNRWTDWGGRRTAPGI